MSKHKKKGYHKIPKPANQKRTQTVSSKQTNTVWYCLIRTVWYWWFDTDCLTLIFWYWLFDIVWYCLIQLQYQTVSNSIKQYQTIYLKHTSTILKLRIYTAKFCTESRLEVQAASLTWQPGEPPLSDLSLAMHGCKLQRWDQGSSGIIFFCSLLFLWCTAAWHGSHSESRAALLARMHFGLI